MPDIMDPFDVEDDQRARDYLDAALASHGHFLSGGQDFTPSTPPLVFHRDAFAMVWNGRTLTPQEHILALRDAMLKGTTAA
jgi:hypothetical protein